MGNKKKPEGYRAEYRMNYQQRSKEEEKPEQIEHGTLEYRSDGTQISDRKIMMSETDMKNPTFVLKAHGYDPKEFELVNAKNNFWSVISKDEERIAYQSKITVKPRTSNDLTREDITEIVKNATPRKHRPIYQPKYDDPVALQINFADTHLGAYSWITAVGEENNMQVTCGKIYDIIGKAKKLISKYPVEKVYICFLGDFLHVDTMLGTTTKGTKLEVDGDPRKAVENAYDLVMYIIDELSMFETEVLWVDGNHSRLVEYAVFQSLPYIYAKNPHIKFDIRPLERKAFFYKGNLVGLFHGDMPKSEVFNWIQVEYRKEWGEANYVEQHCGHLHKEDTEEKGGIIKRTNPTTKKQDGYEYHNGWKSNKAVMSYVWSETGYLESQHYIR